jgi:uncharacterized protein (DUF1800 family)
MGNADDIALMAHLMRRAGFGASRTEIEVLAEQGYDDTVEQLLRPEDQPDLDEYELYRYLPMAESAQMIYHGQVNWMYRIVNGHRPLQEKTALFWHQVFATGNSKVGGIHAMIAQIEMFRRHGMGNYKELLVELAKSPAMIKWLDNDENHKRAPNENWGRELLELFSLGVGNYTEKDVFECARAFTGWTYDGKISNIFGLGAFNWQFIYRAEDHDASEKSFLGHTGRFNGEDVIDIVVEQPACHRFVARHLYNFFVADEPQVPAWPVEPPKDQAAVDILAGTFVSSGLEMRPVLRTLFKSDFFKESMYEKVKNPTEVVAGTLKMTGDLSEPDPRWLSVSTSTGLMGQALLDPPSVEGWHTGREWINSGAFMGRVNFVADQVTNTDLPGVQDIIRRVAASDSEMSPETLVDRCLDLMGPLEVADETKGELVEHAEAGGPISWGTEEEYREFSGRVGGVLALIAGTTEYQFG